MKPRSGVRPSQHRTDDAWFCEEPGWWTRTAYGGVVRGRREWTGHVIDGPDLGPFASMDDAIRAVEQYVKRGGAE